MLQADETGTGVGGGPHTSKGTERGQAMCLAEWRQAREGQLGSPSKEPGLPGKDLDSREPMTSVTGGGDTVGSMNEKLLRNTDMTNVSLESDYFERLGRYRSEPRFVGAQPPLTVTVAAVTASPESAPAAFPGSPRYMCIVHTQEGVNVLFFLREIKETNLHA